MKSLVTLTLALSILTAFTNCTANRCWFSRYVRFSAQSQIQGVDLVQKQFGMTAAEICEKLPPSAKDIRIVDETERDMTLYLQFKANEADIRRIADENPQKEQWPYPPKYQRMGFWFAPPGKVLGTHEESEEEQRGQWIGVDLKRRIVYCYFYTL